MRWTQAYRVPARTWGALQTSVPGNGDERPDRPARSSRSVRGHLPQMTENRSGRMKPTVPTCRGRSLPVSDTLQTILPDRKSELYGQMVTNSSPVGTNVPTCLQSSGLRAPIVRSRGDVRPRYADERPPRCRRPGPVPTNRGCMWQDAVCAGRIRAGSQPGFQPPGLAVRTVCYHRHWQRVHRCLLVLQ